MSKILSGIGKIFKKIAKVAKTVIPIALGVAAVVFTGGAALGILPTFSGAIGGLVSSLGISGALGGALTGSIVSAGFGAAVGGLTGGIKGAQKGALSGAVLGGALGAASPSFFGMGATPAGGGATASWGDTTNSGVNGLLANGGDAITSGAPAAAGGASVAPAIAAPTNGLLPSFLSNPAGMTVAGNVLTGLFTPSEASTYANARARDASRLYGDIYSTGDNSGAPTGYTDPRVAVRPVRRFRFNPESLQVEEVANAR